MLAVAHPLSNFRNNLHVMSNSLVCTQMKVVNSTAKLVKLALAPINGQPPSGFIASLCVQRLWYVRPSLTYRHSYTDGIWSANTNISASWAKKYSFLYKTRRDAQTTLITKWLLSIYTICKIGVCNLQLGLSDLNLTLTSNPNPNPSRNTDPEPNRDRKKHNSETNANPKL